MRLYSPLKASKAPRDNLEHTVRSAGTGLQQCGQRLGMAVVVVVAADAARLIEQCISEHFVHLVTL